MYFPLNKFLFIVALTMASELTWSMNVIEKQEDRSRKITAPNKWISGWRRNLHRKKDGNLDKKSKTDVENKNERRRHFRRHPLHSNNVVSLHGRREPEASVPPSPEVQNDVQVNFDDKMLIAEQFAAYINEKGIIVATRESSPEKKAFLDAMPDSFFRGLYLLIRKSYEEKNSLDAVELIKDRELLQHEPVRSHSDLLPQIENMHVSREVFGMMHEDQALLRVLLPPLVEAICAQKSYSTEKAFMLMFNMFGLHALMTDIQQEAKGRYVDDEKEQEVHQKLKGKMIKLIAINEDGVLAFHNFFTNCLEAGKSSPIASDLYKRLMVLFRECSASHNAEGRSNLRFVDDDA